MAKRVRQVRKPKPIGHRSFSQVDLYLRCGYKYKLRYVDKIPTVGFVPVLMLGSQGHACVEEILTKRLNGKDPDEKTRLEIIEKHRKELGKKFRFELKQAKKQGLPVGMSKNEIMRHQTVMERLLRTWNRDVFPETDPVSIEQKYTIDIDGENVIAYIDLIEKRGNENRILDWKFVGKAKSDRDLMGSLQLSLYSMMTDIPTVGFGSFIKPKDDKPLEKWKPRVQILDTYRKAHEIDWAREVFTDVFRGIRGGHFPRCGPDNFLCNAKYCEYWDICRGKNEPKDPSWLG